MPAPEIIYIDTFTSSGTTYTVQYNMAGGNIETSPPGDFGSVSSADRGRSDHQYITTLSISGTAYDFFASFDYPFATMEISSTGDGGGTGGGTPSCDLTITHLALTGLSSAGANDGTLTVLAHTSQLPMQYSLDNTHWFSGPTFSNLPAGSGTVYVIDALGCTASQSYTITAGRLISTPADVGSRWSALFNPIVFGYQSVQHIPGRKFITQITSGYDGASNVITATHSANLTGYCRADISKYLRTLLLPQDELNYTSINYRDANISASYTVKYKEDGDADWTSAGDPFYVTYSAMQIGNPTGGNMAPYVTLPAPGQTNPAKFLNDFITPVLYTDMPWDISFIYSEKVAGYPLKAGGNGIDINGNICGSLGESMLMNEDGSVLLNEDGSRMLIEKESNAPLVNKLGVNRLRITQNIPAQSIWLDVFLFYTDGSGNNIPVTESRRLLLDNSPCNGLPYEYLKWMGPTGGWLYYMLIKNQFHELNTGNAVLMDRYISDYATADSTQQLISISAQKKITAGKVGSALGLLKKDGDAAATNALTLSTNAGNATKGFEALTTGTEVASGGVSTFTKALAGTGIGLIIIAVAALIEYLKQVTPVVDAVERVTVGLTGGFNALGRIVMDLLSPLKKLFTDPKQAMKDLVDFLEQNVLNGLKPSV